jgi:fibronectin-binding autotransporter adhesin
MGYSQQGVAAVNRKFIYRLLVIVLLAGLFPQFASALDINDYTAVRNNRFSSNYPYVLTPNTDPSFIGAGYDWSGVGWNANNSSQSFALLGPRHYIYANHYPAGVGSQLDFTSGDGTVKQYTIQAQSGSLYGDLAVGSLTAPISAADNIQPYSILFLGYATGLNSNPYEGLQMLQYGWTAKIGWNQLQHVVKFADDPSHYYFDYSVDTTTPDRTQLISGDSGSPSFIVTGATGQLFLSGAHYGYYTDGSGGVDSSAPLALSQISSYMAQTGYLPYVVTPATARWTGMSISTPIGSWSAPSNWSTLIVPADTLNVSGQVTNCASVLFDGVTATNRSVTLAANQGVTGIAFNGAPNSGGGSNAFSISGSTYTLTIGEAGLTNNDDDAQTINCPVALRASQRWNVGKGGLQLNGTVSTGTSAGYLLLIEGAGNVTAAGIISGPGSLAKDGAGVLTLSNAGNSYSGRTFINGGAIAVSQDGHLGTAPTSFVSNQLTINGGTLRASGSFIIPANRGIFLDSLGGNISVDSGLTLTGSSVISGSGSLTKSDAGTLKLTAFNTFTGPTTSIKGSLVLSGANGAIAQSSAYNVIQGSIVLDNSDSNPLGLTGRLADNATLTLRNGVFQMLANGGGSSETLGVISANFGENSFGITTCTGNSTITAGNLAINSGATINFTGTGTGGSLGVNNKIVINGLTAGFVDQGTFVGGSDYAVYDAGGFIRAMVAGEGSSDYSTGIAPNHHVLLTSSALNQDDTTLLTLKLAGSGVDFSLNAGKTLALVNGGILKTGGGSSTISGGNGLYSAEEYVIRVDYTSDVLTINNVIGGSSGLTKSGLGTLILGNGGNSYSGSTTVAAGTLKLSATGAIPPSTNLVVAGSAVFDLNGYDASAANITLSSGTIQSSGGPATLTLIGNSGAVNYVGAAGVGTISVGAINLASSGALSGTHTFTIAAGKPPGVDLTVLSAIANGSTNSQELVKDGPGTLKLMGANTYTGGTTVLAGTLMLGNVNVLSGTSNVTVSGGTLAIDGYSNTIGALILQSGSIVGTAGVLTATSFNVQSGEIGAILGGSADLRKSTTGIVTLSAANTYTGTTYLNEGVLSVSNNNQLGNPSNALTFNGGTLRITGGTSASFASSPRTINWNSGGGFDIVEATNTLALSQNLSGPGQLTKAGLGTLSLTGAIGSANISIQDGTLRIGGANLLTGSPVVSIRGTATLDFNNNNNTVGSLVMSGGSVLTGDGTLTLAGDVTYNRSSWPALIDGYLSLGSSSRTFNVSKGASSDLTVTASISGSNLGLTKTGDGILVLEAFNTYSGATNVLGGVLRTDDMYILSSNITLNDGVWESIDDDIYRSLGTTAGKVQITGGTSGFSAYSISPSTGATSYVNLGGDGMTVGPAVVWGSATFNPSILVLNEYTANVPLIFRNPLKLNAGTTPVQRDIEVNSDDSSATISGAISDGDSGAGAASLVKSGVGTLILSGTNSYSGSTTIGAGTLRLGNASALGSSATTVTVNSGAALDLYGYTIAAKPAILYGSGLNNSGALVNRSSAPAAMTGPVSLGGNSTVGGLGAIALSGTMNYNTFSLTKTASNTLTLSGSQTWGGNSAVTVQSGTLKYALDSADSVSVAGGNSITVNSGATLELAGSKSALSDAINRVNIINNSTVGLIVSGSNQLVGAISGTGIMTIQAGADLTATRIFQDSLILNGTSGSPAILRLGSYTGGGSGAASSDYSGSGGVGQVPEPGVWALLAAGVLVGLCRLCFIRFSKLALFK